MFSCVTALKIMHVCGTISAERPSYHAHIASPRRCDQFHGRAGGDGTWPLYHTPVMIQRIAADRWIWLRCIKVKDVTKASRIVVKVGTSTLTHANGLLNFRRIDELARVLSDLKNEGKKVVLVSSGAIGVGAAKLGMNGKPHELKEKPVSYTHLTLSTKA